MCNNWSNIIHFTTQHNHGWYAPGDMRRAPAIWFWPGTNNLHIVVGNWDGRTGNRHNNWHSCDNESGVLSVNPHRWNTVKLEVIKNKVKVYINDILRCNKNLVGITLDSNNVGIYLSDPWYPSANAFVRNVVYQRFPDIN